MKSILDGRNFSQVGYVVKDIETARRSFARLLGMDVPDVVSSGEYEVTGTIYRGQPAPEAASKLAFFNLSSGMQIELIEPNEAPSTWREYLDANGEGIHHLAFQVNDMMSVIKACEAEGMELVQYGKYNDGSGHYAYIDGSKEYKCVIELLESFFTISQDV